MIDDIDGNRRFLIINYNESKSLPGSEFNRLVKQIVSEGWVIHNVSTDPMEFVIEFVKKDKL